MVTTDMGRKEGGGCCAPFAGGAGSPSNTMWPGPRSTSVPSGIHPAIWPQQIWTEIREGCALGKSGTWVPSNRMWPGTRPTCEPSFILIHPTVWPQYTNVIDRQTGQTDRQAKQRSDSIGRTVLQTVAQNETLSYRTTERHALSNQIKFITRMPGRRNFAPLSLCLLKVAMR